MQPKLLVSLSPYSLEVYSSFHQDFFCQHPRFAIHGPGFKQRSPVSVYMRYEPVRNYTYYIISAPESEEWVNSSKMLLNLVSLDGTENNLKRALFQHPLEPHILLSRLLCESSQGFINLFRQSMFAQVIPIYLYSLSDFDNILAATSSRRALRSRDGQPERLRRRNDRASDHFQRRQQTYQRCRSRIPQPRENARNPQPYRSNIPHDSGCVFRAPSAGCRYITVFVLFDG